MFILEREPVITRRAKIPIILHRGSEATLRAIRHPSGPPAVFATHATGAHLIVVAVTVQAAALAWHP